MEMNESREWLPRLIDIIHFAEEGDPDERLYFSRFGFDKLVIPDDCVHVRARFDELTMRFNERYEFRRLGQETMPRWQVRLQNRMDSIVRKYERAYELYEDFATDIHDDVLEGEKEVLSGADVRTVNSEGASHNSGTTKVIDTPDSRVNENDNYADAYTKNASDATNTDNATDTVDYGRVRTKTYTGKMVIENINMSIDSWRDLDTALVGEFEDMFMNVFE